MGMIKQWILSIKKTFHLYIYNIPIDFVHTKKQYFNYGQNNTIDSVNTKKKRYFNALIARGQSWISNRRQELHCKSWR